ncbi:MAG: enolase [Treponema sp.]|nr:enolase [Treponema sp.]
MEKNERGALIILYRLLLVLLICLVLVIIGLTLYSLVFGKKGDAAVPAAVPAGVPQTVQDNSDSESIFTGIGRLRLPAADSDVTGSVVVISITFPYDPDDWAFTEELAARIKDFRTIAGDFMLETNTSELSKMSEDQLKNTLLERFNRILRLGKIRTLYFNDFMVIE